MPVNFGVGFNVTAKEPIDTRLVLTKQEMRTERYALTGGTIAIPDNYLFICSDDNRLYVYNDENPVSPETGKFRLESGITSQEKIIDGKTFNYLLKDNIKIQVESAVLDKNGQDITEALSQKQPLITFSNPLSADKIDDSISQKKLVTLQQIQTWNQKQDKLPSGGKDTFLHKNEITGILEWKQVHIEVDDHISPISTNPVQNKVIYQALIDVTVNPETYFCGEVPSEMATKLLQDVQHKKPIIIDNILYQYQKQETDLQDNRISYAIYQSMDWTPSSLSTTNTNKLFFKFILITLVTEGITVTPTYINQHNVSIYNQ